MKIIILEEQLKLLKELDLNNLDDLEKIGDYYDMVPKSVQKKLANFLELVRQSGLVNMFESGQFLFMTKDHFDDMIKFRSHRENFDDKKQEIISEISSQIEMIRNLMISSAIQYLEKKELSLTDQNIQSAIKKMISTSLSFWMQRLIKK